MNSSSVGAPAAAFTLIEMLVVIGIIALLAGLIIGLFPRFADLKVRARVKGELAQVETAINTYVSKRGFLPPDNPNNPGSNALYYELVGTIFDGAKYTTFTGDSALAKNDVSTAFGAGGFINSNSTLPGGAEDARNFHPALKASQQVKEMNVNGVNVKLLGVSIRGPSGDFSPWYYNSSAPAHNQNGYDLWVIVTINGQPRTFGNWKE